MKKVSLNGGEIKLHYRPQPHVLKKAIRMAQDLLNGLITPRKLSNGKFSVVEVNDDDRIVVDANNKIHLMGHEKYNTFVNRR